MKRIDALRDLSDDHHDGLVLAQRCKRAGDPRSDAPPERMWAHVLAVFAGQLEPHFRIEEEHLVPALEAIGEDALAARIRDDHRALRELTSGAAADRTALAQFGRLLEGHIRFEERQVFEPTQARLPEDALRRIAAACRAIPRSCEVPLEP